MTTLAIVVVLAELAAAAVIAALGLWRFRDVHGCWPLTRPRPPAGRQAASAPALQPASRPPLALPAPSAPEED